MGDGFKGLGFRGLRLQGRTGFKSLGLRVQVKGLALRFSLQIWGLIRVHQYIYICICIYAYIYIYIDIHL